jgi:hypothetical protein
MTDLTDPLEEIWDGLLSRQPERIRTAFARLTEAEQSAALAHLRRMASEPDWQPEQRQSAQVALDCLANFS